MAKNLALVDMSILSDLASAESNFTSIMLLARQLQGTHVVDAGTLKTIEDLLFVARVDLADVILRVVDRLTQYRALAREAFVAVADVEGIEVAAVWPQVVTVSPGFCTRIANDHHGSVA